MSALVASAVCLTARDGRQVACRRQIQQLANQLVPLDEPSACRRRADADESDWRPFGIRLLGSGSTGLGPVAATSGESRMARTGCVDVPADDL